MSKGIFYAKAIIVAIITLIILSYGYYRSKNLIDGPMITVDSPINGQTVEQNPINIIGSARNVAFLSLDDGQIYVNDQGKFNRQLLLSPGYNIISIKARDKFGRKTERRIEIVLKQ